MTSLQPTESTEQFFDRIAADYTAMIHRCVPRYDEMLHALLDYFPEGFAPGCILELGAGTGNLSVLVAERFPEAELVLLDISGELLAESKRRLAGRPNVTTVRADMREFAPEPQSFDLVISSISIHHLTHNEKAKLFKQVYQWLAPTGCFTYCDQFAGETDDIYQRHIDRWQAEAFRLGTTLEEWNTWMKHQHENDYHASLPQQLDWLRHAGFDVVDCTWRHLLWTVVVGRMSGL